MQCLSLKSQFQGTPGPGKHALMSRSHVVLLRWAREKEWLSVRGHVFSGLCFHPAQELGYPSAVNRVTLTPTVR